MCYRRGKRGKAEEGKGWRGREWRNARRSTPPAFSRFGEIKFSSDRFGLFPFSIPLAPLPLAAHRFFSRPTLSSFTFPFSHLPIFCHLCYAGSSGKYFTLYYFPLFRISPITASPNFSAHRSLSISFLKIVVKLFA